MGLTEAVSNQGDSAAAKPVSGDAGSTPVPSKENTEGSPSPRGFHLGEGLDVSRGGNVVTVSWGERSLKLEEIDWIKTINATLDCPNSPEGRTVIEFLLNASPGALEWLADQVQEANESYAPLGG